MVKTAVSYALFSSLMLGKQYKSVELQESNKYEVSGDTLEKYERMVDEGFINEAENILLVIVPYHSKAMKKGLEQAILKQAGLK